MAEPLVPGDGVDLLAALKRGWEARDVDALLALLAEDADIRPDPFGAACVGTLAIRAWLTGLMARAANTELDAERSWVVGRTVLAAWHGALTDRAGARRIRLRGFLALDLDAAGRIARLRAWPLHRDVGVDATIRPEGGPPLLEGA
ncbi:MAG: nuclear transport factor 2 family protein [Chloroflexota bacterium]